MASKAVNVPVDEKRKEQDINTKLQLYGIYAGTQYRHQLCSASEPIC